MTEISCEELFPTRLFKTKYYPSDLEDIKKYIIRNHKHHTKPNIMSSVNDNAFLGLDTDIRFFSLKKDITGIFNKILTELYQVYHLEPNITSMWSTCNIPGEGGQMHMHTNSYFSGVFYPFESTASNINFYSPLQDKCVLDIGGNVKQWNNFNSPSFEFEPKECDLIFFPSYFLHQVMFNNSNERRYSLVFNIFLRGEFKAPTSELSIG